MVRVTLACCISLESGTFKIELMYTGFYWLDLYSILLNTENIEFKLSSMTAKT